MANEDVNERVSPYPEEPIRDLGFGSIVARESRLRFLNKDGTFNLRRHGLALLRSVPVYRSLTTIPWGRFYLIAGLGYLVVNILFAIAYTLSGPTALGGVEGRNLTERLLEGFFFSVQTLTTVGYGSLSPGNLAANLVMSLEVLVGLGGFAVMAALVFARLARPSANIHFSRRAVIGPYQDGSGFMFRIANARRGELFDVSVRVIFSWLEGETPTVQRRFETLNLERRRVTFFPLHWTIVHPIDESSPLRDRSPTDLEASHAEFLIQVAATDEIYSEVVRARSSYVADEIVWDQKFASILETTEDGVIGIDLRRIHELEDVTDSLV